MTNAALSKIAVDGMSSLLSDRVTGREVLIKIGRRALVCEGWLALIARGQRKVVARCVKHWQEEETETAPRLSAKRRRGAVFFSVFICSERRRYFDPRGFPKWSQ
jgi:hypothetical protein